MIKLADETYEPQPPPRRRPAGQAAKTGIEAYLASIRDLPLLARDDEQRLFRQLRHGRPAERHGVRNAIVQANLRLVVKVALAYRDFGVPVCDLVSEGNLGLLKAVDRFDPERGVRFATYAVWWIRQDIRRALDYQTGQVRLPTHLRERIRHYRSLRGRLGRQPSAAETRQVCGGNRHSAADLLRAEQFREVSLQATAGPRDEREQCELIPDSSLSPERITIEAENRSLVGRLLADLDPRSRQVIKLRFGLESAEPVSLEKIAVRVGLSRERVRQIQQETMAWMQVRIDAVPQRLSA